MISPQIVAPDYGKHNAMLEAAARRMEQSAFYRDLSTVVIVPAFGHVPTKCVASWMNLINPPNQKIFRIWALGYEVGMAYSLTIRSILDHPDLSKFKYILTIEHDNAPEPDGLVKLLQRMEERPEFSVISGCYWTKGEGGVPQIWGDPLKPINFTPQLPRAGELVECNGTGMGFALWRMDMFKDEKLRYPWFRTIAEMTPSGAQCYTQDLYFAEDAKKHGYRFAVDCGILVGHYDEEGKFGPPDTMW